MSIDNIKRISKKNYQPSHEDMVRVCQKTSGITFKSFVSNKITYLLYDIGGRSSERKKWGDCKF